MSSDNPSKWYEKTNSSFYDEIKNHVIGKRYIYETLLETNDKENVLEVMKQAHARWGVDMAETHRQNTPSLTSYNDFKQAMKQAFESMQRNHLIYSIKVDSDEKLGFNVTKCIFSEVCKELNSTELGYAIFCHGDYDYARTLHPKGRMVRNRTLMQGDAYCDHTYIWKEEQMLVEKSFDTGEVVLNYAEGPDNGPPLLLIHGLTNRWQVWMPILPTLMTRWHIYAVNRRGYGRSDRVPGRYFPKDYISDLTALVNNLIKEPTVIYGHSAGGQLALALAAKHPLLVRAVIAGDPPLNKEYQLELMDGAASTMTRRRAQAGRPFKELVSDLSGTMEPRELLYTAKTMSSIDPDVFTYLAEGRADEYFEGFNIDDILTMVTCPVLLLQGVIIRDIDVEKVILTMSDVTVVSIKDRGHMLGLSTWDVAPLLRSVMNFLESLR